MFVLHKACLAACAAVGILGSATQGAIHDAAAKGDLQTVKAAIAADPALVDAEKPPNKKTALHYAAQNGRAEVVHSCSTRAPR